jgi:hypothetical protein
LLKDIQKGNAMKDTHTPTQKEPKHAESDDRVAGMKQEGNLSSKDMVNLKSDQLEDLARKIKRRPSNATVAKKYTGVDPLVASCSRTGLVLMITRCGSLPQAIAAIDARRGRSN